MGYRKHKRANVLGCVCHGRTPSRPVLEGVSITKLKYMPTYRDYANIGYMRK